MNNEQVERTLQKVKELPSLPNVVRRTLEVIDDPESSAKNLNDIILNDPALSAKIMKLVNSAFFGFPGEIDSLKEAIVILGFNTIRSLALSLSIIDYFRPMALKTNFDFNQLWIHSIGVGNLCRTIAKRESRELAEEMFLCGLLHDVGHLTLSQFFVNEFNQALDIMNEDRILLHQAERAVFQTDHAEVAEALFLKWNFPKSICETIGSHHDFSPDAEPSRVKKTAILHVSDVAMKLMGIGGVGDNSYLWEINYHPQALAVLQLDSETLRGYEPKVSAAVSAGGKILALA